MKGIRPDPLFNSKRPNYIIVVNLVLASNKTIRPDLVCSSNQSTYAEMMNLGLNSIKGDKT